MPGIGFALAVPAHPAVAVNVEHMDPVALSCLDAGSRAPRSLQVVKVLRKRSRRGYPRTSPSMPAGNTVSRVAGSAPPRPQFRGRSPRITFNSSFQRLTIISCQRLEGKRFITY